MKKRTLRNVSFALWLTALLVTIGVQAAPAAPAWFRAGAALADPVIRISPSSSLAQPGDVFVVDVVVDNAVDLFGFDVTVAFNPAVVHVQNVTLGSFLGSTGRTEIALGPDIDNGAGRFTFGGSSSGAAPGPNGTGTVAQVTLRAMAPGSTALTFTEAALIDTQGSVEWPQTRFPGSVTVSGPTQTHTPTPTPIDTLTQTPTATPTPSGAPTQTPTQGAAPSATETLLPAHTSTATPTVTETLTLSPTLTPMPTEFSVYLPVAIRYKPPTPTPNSTPSPTATLTPSSIIYDGEWEGFTALGLPVSFRVEDNLVKHFAAEYDTASCHVTIEPTLPYFGTIINGSFSISSPYIYPEYAWHFAGTFSSSSKATGVFTARMAGCGRVDTTWEASRK
jgi:hypothetical protein